MRNLKRALSLALASIMLLGMMVTGAGAVSTISNFTDADQINNVEAAEVTAGIGIFEGYNDGTFGPERVVNRAEMAVIICKILNGPDVDPGNFTGVKIFNDVPEWAEGYVNYCHTMKIVVGTGEGKFDPSEPVTTVQAATMLLKALGYYIDDNAQLGADWKTTVTGKATYLKLYGDLTLGVDEGLTRDNVAELVFNTIQAQRVAYDDNRNLYVKNTNRQEVVTNGTDDWDNTLADDTFGMRKVTGLVTANSETDVALSETTNNSNRTRVDFTRYKGSETIDGRSYTSYDFAYTTGLDLIGHEVRVYYSDTQHAHDVYAIVDMATKVEYVTYDSNTTRLADNASAAGFRRNSILNDAPQSTWWVNYDSSMTVADAENYGANATSKLAGRPSDPDDPAKTLIVISNSDDYKVDVVIVLDQYLDTVARVSENSGAATYELTSGRGNDLNIAHSEVAAGDYIIVTNIGNRGSVFNFTKAETQTANITTITRTADTGLLGSSSFIRGAVQTITADGTEYKGSPVYDHRLTRAALANTTNFEVIETIGEATLILDERGNCIGLGEPESVPNYAYAAVFGERHITSGLMTMDRPTVRLYFADGTSGTYEINISNTNGGTFAGWDYQTNDFQDLNFGLNAGGTRNTTFNQKSSYTSALSIDGNKDLVLGTGTGLGVYSATVRGDGTVTLKAMHHADIGNINYVANVVSGSLRARLVPSLSNLVLGTTYVSDGDGHALSQTAKTNYFYVSGAATVSTNATNPVISTSGLTVGTRVGVANAVGFTHGSDSDSHNGNGPDEFTQLFAGALDFNARRRNVSAALIYGLRVDTDRHLVVLPSSGAQGQRYTVSQAPNSRADGKFIITFHTYELTTGEALDVVDDNDGNYYESAAAAIRSAEEREVGWYNVASHGLDTVATWNGDYNGTLVSNIPGYNDYTFIINARAEYDENEHNLYVYTIDDLGSILPADVKVIDLTGHGMTSVGDFADARRANATVRVSYAFRTGTTDPYKTLNVFVTQYDPAPINGGNGNDNFVGQAEWVSYSGGQNGTFTVYWHKGDRDLTKTYAENLIRELTGEEDVSVNLTLGTVKIGQTASWQNSGYTLVTQERVIIRYGNNAMYVNKTPRSAPDITSLGLGDDHSAVFALKEKPVEAGQIVWNSNKWEIDEELLDTDVTIVKGAVVKMTNGGQDGTAPGTDAGQTTSAFKVTLGSETVEYGDIVPVGGMLTAESVTDIVNQRGWATENFILTVSVDGVEKDMDSTFNNHNGTKVARLSCTVPEDAKTVTFGWEWGVVLKAVNGKVTYSANGIQPAGEIGANGVGYALVRQGTTYNVDTYPQYYCVLFGLAELEDVNGGECYANSMTPMTATLNTNSQSVAGTDGVWLNYQYITVVSNLVLLFEAKGTNQGESADGYPTELLTALAKMGVSIADKNLFMGVHAHSDGSDYTTKIVALGSATINKASDAAEEATGFAVKFGADSNKWVAYGSTVKEAADTCGTYDGKLLFPGTLIMEGKLNEADGTATDVSGG